VRREDELLNVEFGAGFKRWAKEGWGIIRVVAGDGGGINGAYEAGQDGEEGGGGRRWARYSRKISQETYGIGWRVSRWIVLGHPKRQALTKASFGRRES